jgi:hypothetical protein
MPKRRSNEKHSCVRIANGFVYRGTLRIESGVVTERITRRSPHGDDLPETVHEETFSALLLGKADPRGYLKCVVESVTYRDRAQKTAQEASRLVAGGKS